MKNGVKQKNFKFERYRKNERERERESNHLKDLSFKTGEKKTINKIK